MLGGPRTRRLSYVVDRCVTGAVGQLRRACSAGVRDERGWRGGMSQTASRALLVGNTAMRATCLRCHPSP
jgi:hypothetical protein